MSEQEVEQGTHCEAPRCLGPAVTAVPDSTIGPRYWRVCESHLAFIRSPFSLRWRRRIIRAVRAEPVEREAVVAAGMEAGE